MNACLTIWPRAARPSNSVLLLALHPDLVLFTRTGHDDAHPQTRGGDPPSPVGRMPREAERGEWRGEEYSGGGGGSRGEAGLAGLGQGFEGGAGNEVVRDARA